MITLEGKQNIQPLILCRRIMGRFVSIFCIKQTELIRKLEYSLVVSPLYGVVFILRENIKPFIELHTDSGIDPLDHKAHHAEWGMNSWNAWPYKIRTNIPKRGYSYVVKQPIFLVKKENDTKARLMKLKSCLPKKKHDCSSENRIFSSEYLDAGGGYDNISQENILKVIT